MSNHVEPHVILDVLRTTRGALAELDWIQGYSYQVSTAEPPVQGLSSSLVWRANSLPWGKIEVEQICGVCLAGALCLASYELFGPSWENPCVATESVLEEVSGFRSVSSFNDWPLRTKAEVLELVEKAITTIEERA